jgi:alkylation response protein AidB-like acyl-CoA dehydrogenase
MAVADQQHSREVAEGARQKTWAGRGFLRQLFLGNYHFNWLDDGKTKEPAMSREAADFMQRLEHFFEHEVDSAAIDEKGEYPKEVIDGLRRLGAFGMKIGKEYGGVGLSQLEYARALEICGRYDGNIVALLSAHQSIGVPQPLKIFGTEAQKQKYLPRCAKGAISAFALTEVNVGSDPASLATTAERTPSGDYILNGEKLWCTNGTFAELIVVMARHPDSRKISAFVVEADWPGVELGPRCHFMGLRALENGLVKLRGVRVPKENLIGKEGEGLKIALVTLNTGRLGLPAACVGFSKHCTEVVRRWGSERVQWGLPVGQHEAVAHKIADMASSTFAMQAVSDLSSELAQREGYDIRLEAAVAKEWCSVRGWRIVDTTMQIRGGRGYETEHSLRSRGEPAINVERLMRDSRINLIFEGSSEIMHLFIAREAVDKHLEVAGALVDPKASLGKKLKALPAIIAFYAWWYPTRFLKFALWPKYSGLGALGAQLRYCERTAARLARALFHGMLVHGPKLERKQAFLFRVVDIAMELYVISAAVLRASRMQRAGDRNAESAVELALGFTSLSRQRIEDAFVQLFNNDDSSQYKLARAVLAGRYEWLEGSQGAARLPAQTASPLKPKDRKERAA